MDNMPWPQLVSVFEVLSERKANFRESPGTTRSLSLVVRNSVHTAQV